MPTAGTINKGEGSTHQDLMTLMSKLERLKATSDLLEKEVAADIKQFKDQWDIEDVGEALKSIESIATTAQQHAKNRDEALAKATKILDKFNG